MSLTAVRSLAFSLAFAIACGGSDSGGTAPPPPKNPNVIGASGGTVSVSGGAASLAIPAGALSSEVTISITPKSDPAADSRALSGTTYEFGPAGTTFAQPVTLSLKYDKTKLPAGGDQRELRVAQLTSDGTWAPVTDAFVIDSTNGQVKVNVTKLGGAAAARRMMDAQESAIPFAGGTKAWTSWSPIWTVYYPPASPCTPVTLALGSPYAGQLSDGDCVQDNNNRRRSDMYTVTTTAQSVLLLSVTGGVKGPFGVQAAGLAAYSSATMGGDTLATLVPAGTWRIFLSGQDSTVRGNYTISASAVPLSSRSGCAWLYVVPGQSLDGRIVDAPGSTNCSAVIPPDDYIVAFRGLTTYYDYYAVRMLAGRTYTVSVSAKGAGNPCPALWQGGKLIVPWMTSGPYPRSYKVTPTADLYYGVEVENCSTSDQVWTPVSPMEYTLSITG